MKTIIAIAALMGASAFAPAASFAQEPAPTAPLPLAVAPAVLMLEPHELPPLVRQLGRDGGRAAVRSDELHCP